MTLVSVVIPSHNYGRFLGRAIESVLAQQYSSIELIVIDDGSTDDTFAVANRYPISRCIQQRNLGPSEARNRGLEAAGGDFILFLDADDQLTDGAIATSIECLLDRPDCAFVYGHAELTEMKGARISKTPERSARLQTCVEGDPYAHMLRWNNPIRNMGAILYRMDVVRRLGGFTGQREGDLDLNLRIASQYPICCNDRVVLSILLHDANISLSFAAMLRDTLWAQRRQRSFVKRNPLYKDDYEAGLRLARSYWGSRLAQHVIAETRAGQISSAVRDLWTLARFAPREGAVALLRAACGMARRVIGSRRS
jgi:glycosyltransferase involved in cell wall biosynthesis